MAGTKHEVNRIREGQAGQVIFTDNNGVSSWVNPADLPAIIAASTAAAAAQAEVDTLEGIVTTVSGVADAAATAAAAAQAEVDTLEGIVTTVSGVASAASSAAAAAQAEVDTLEGIVTTVSGVADSAATAAAAAQAEVDTLEGIVTTVSSVADAAAAAATQAQSEVDALETVVANIEAMKPIYKRVKVGTFTNMTGKTQHLILPTGVNLHSLKVYKDGLLYSEGDDYTQVSNGSGVSVTGMEAYENTEILHFEIIVTDAASRTSVTNFHGTTNYTGQYPN